MGTTSTEGLLDNLTSGGEKLQSSFEVGLVLGAHSTVSVLTEGVVTNTKSTLVGKRARYFTLQLVGGDTDNTGIIDKSIFGGVFLGLEGSEKGLLSSEDLDGRGRLLGQVDETSGVGDQFSGNELTDESS